MDEGMMQKNEEVAGEKARGGGGTGGGPTGTGLTPKSFLSSDLHTRSMARPHDKHAHTHTMCTHNKCK